MKDCGMIKFKMRRSDSIWAGVAALVMMVVTIVAGFVNGMPDTFTILLMLLNVCLFAVIAWILLRG